MWNVTLANGRILEGVPDLQFELNNQVFSTAQGNLLPGSFSFPFDLPLSPHNRTVLGNPQGINRVGDWPVFKGVWVSLYGLPLFTGTLSIRTCTPQKVSLTVVANPMEALKEQNLNELDLGGNRTTPTNLAAHMASTITTPSAHDYAFLPLREYPNDAHYHNRYTLSPLQGDLNSRAITPMVKLKYLLSAIDIGDGYAFRNAFQLDGDKELEWLYLYSNRDMRVTQASNIAPSVPPLFNLRDFVPQVRVTDALKRLCAQFCLGVFTNIFQRTVTLEPLNALLRRQTAHDWTGYVASAPTINQTLPAPNYFQFGTLGAELPPDYPPIETALNFNTFDDATYLLLDDQYAGTYVYVEGAYTKVFKATDTNLYFRYPFTFASRAAAANGQSRTEFENQIDSGVSMRNFTYNPAGISGYVGSPATSPTEWEYRNENYGFSLLALRGNQPLLDQGTTCHTVYDTYNTGAPRLELYENGVSQGTARYSLFWHGEYGLFNTWHYLWSNMLLNGKPVVQQFIIPAAVLVSFQFQDKIRVGNMDYFCTKLRVEKAVGKGMVLVEAYLVTVI
jgi:hypothetical protein